ncbi:hypothetical protein P9126_11100 [Bacillus glycinifermentans]|nr:hypothetical protein [Bacillus glycinifermentans]MEC3607532.1 hypothetical protein [Bacillus glycinifermentans]
MEKAMHTSHSLGYGEYARSRAVRLEVEKKREAEYEKRKQIVLQINVTG